MNVYRESTHWPDQSFHKCKKVPEFSNDRILLISRDFYYVQVFAFGLHWIHLRVNSLAYTHTATDGEQVRVKQAWSFWGV